MSVDLKFSRVGVIDIGSNSVRFVVYEIFGGSLTPIYNEKVLAGLGRDLHRTGKLNPAGTAEAYKALQRFKLLAGEQKLSKVLIAATAALRDASDAGVFIRKVQDEIGFDITPLSGEKEAFVSAMGVLAGERRAQGIAADLGGASLELVGIKDRAVSAGVSYPLGPFSLYKGIFNPEILRSRIEEILGVADLSGFEKEQSLYLIGGAWRNLALVHQKRIQYPLRVAHNYQMNVHEAQILSRWASSEEGCEELMGWSAISRRRAETLPYSGLLLACLIDSLKPKDVIIAPGGLRDGLVYTDLPKRSKQMPALFDGCRALAHGGQEGIDFGGPLFEFLLPLHPIMLQTFAQENEERLRKAACLLVGIGKGLHPAHKAKIIFQTVLYAPLPGLTHAERAYLALMLYASYTAKKTTPNDAAIQRLLLPEQQKAARIYGEAMRAFVVLAGRSRNILARCELSYDEKNLKISVDKGFNALITERGVLRLEQLAVLLGRKLLLQTAP